MPVSTHRPLCPQCRTPMRLAGVVPRAFGHPELHSFACSPCREAVTLTQSAPGFEGAARA